LARTFRAKQNIIRYRTRRMFSGRVPKIADDDKRFFLIIAEMKNNASHGVRPRSPKSGLSFLWLGSGVSTASAATSGLHSLSSRTLELTFCD